MSDWPAAPLAFASILSSRLETKTATGALPVVWFWTGSRSLLTGQGDVAFIWWGSPIPCRPLWRAPASSMKSN